ncbi:MAG: radical SAM protein [Prevotella sp.]|nr:radical SAM protein [Prevotella sp.]
MSTIIYPSPIFGPVHSRRLGVSLGINLLPADGKLCTFDCLYCECGLNAAHRPKLTPPTREQVAEALEQKLQQMAAEGLVPDVLTFAGNGEPTVHPHFADIIGDTIALRNRYCPQAKVSVLSNATQLHRPDVVEALMQVDNNIQKLDTVDMDFIRFIDRPLQASYDVNRIVEQLCQFKGHVIIQTMFLGADVSAADGISFPEAGILPKEKSEENQIFTNITDFYIQPWLEAVKRIQPQQVMIYTIDRETPVSYLRKASHADLDRIRDLVIAAGIPCSASY